MKKVALNSIINSTMFIYILSLYILTYQEVLNKISNATALLLIGLIWINRLLLRERIEFNKFLILYLIFIGICLISVSFSIDSSITVVKIRTLILLFILLLSLINYIDTIEKLHKLMKYFVYSGFIASIYILLNADFTVVTRFGSELGNVNAIGMILGISSVFCLYFIIEKKVYKLIPMLFANAIVILLTGSRKSMLFLIFTLIVIIFSKSGKKIGGKIKVFLWNVIILFIVLYAIYNIPIFYEIIGIRMENLFHFAFGEGTKEGSMNTRYMMIQLGWDWFKVRPVTGYGIDNYRILLRQLTGVETYSHNNIIELLVGVGIFGAMGYYLTQIVIIMDLLKASKLLSKCLTYAFLAIILGHIFMSVGLIYYDEKHINIILAVGSVIYKLGKKENKEFAHLIKIKEDRK